MLYSDACSGWPQRVAVPFSFTSDFQRSSKPAPLPPCFGLYAIGQSVRSILVWHAAYQTAKAVRPVRIGDEGTQHWPAEKLAPRSDLRSQGKLPQPPIVLANSALCMIKPGFERQGKMLAEKHDRPRPK